VKAIFTKYHRSTANKPHRVSASDGNTRIYVSPADGCDCASPDCSNIHEYAAEMLCHKLHKAGNLAYGELQNGGFVFVFVNPEKLLEVG